MTSRTVAVDGVRFHLERAEPKRRRRTTPTLLLHGVPQTADVWRDLIPQLATDRIVLAPDLKGLGRSEAREPYDAGTLVAELAALVLHEVDGPVDVVGHDWGGSLAIGLASHRPELVRRLVVISAPYRKVDLKRAFHMPLMALPGLPEVGFRLAGEHLVRTMFRRAWGSGTPLDEEQLRAYVEAYTPPHRVSAMLAYYRAAIRGRLRHAIGGKGGGARRRVTAERSLVIWGTADPAMPMSVGEAAHRDLGANATMLTLPGVGHFGVDEAPDVVLPAITEFLRAP